MERLQLIKAVNYIGKMKHDAIVLVYYDMVEKEFWIIEHGKSDIGLPTRAVLICEGYPHEFFNYIKRAIVRDIMMRTIEKAI